MPIANNAGGMTYSVIFPDQGHQVLSVLVHLLGCSVLAACFARRFSVNNMTLAKFCILAIFVDSWLFVFSAGVVVSGVGMSFNNASCLSGIYLCIFFYASSKILIYLFLAEKVHIVWSSGKQVGRFKSKVWLVCFVVLFGYLTVFILMLIGKIGYLRDDDHVCIIGLRSMASIPLLAYDCFLNLFLTGLFVWPLMCRNLSTQNLRNLATRTCWAAAVALATSVVNIAILTSLHGQQQGWVCLASCGVDVTINAVVIFAVSHRKDNPNHFEADSPRAPVSSEKLVSDRNSPRVTIFKGKVEKPKPVFDRSFMHSADFAATRADESVLSVTAINSTSYSNMFDYLPKDQLSEMESQSKTVTPASERSQSSLYVNQPFVSCDNDREPSSYNISGNTGSFISHERRRGSRGIMAEFRDRIGKGRSGVDDMSIQVTVTTEQTPNNDSQLGLDTITQQRIERPLTPATSEAHAF